MEQLDLFGTPKFHIGNRPIRLIEMFAGVGSQLLSLRNLGVDVESHFVCEFDKNPIKGFNAIHGTNYEPIDICDVHGEDLKIVEREIRVHLNLEFPLSRYLTKWKWCFARGTFRNQIKPCIRGNANT